MSLFDDWRHYASLTFEDFMFQLTKEEAEALRSRFVIVKNEFEVTICDLKHQARFYSVGVSEMSIALSNPRTFRAALTVLTEAYWKSHQRQLVDSSGPVYNDAAKKKFTRLRTNLEM